MGWWKTAKPGDKVVYVWPRDAVGMNPYPPKGAVCTISWVGLTSDGDVAVDVSEYPQPEDKFWSRGYMPEAFKPVEKRKTDISIFTAMLHRSKSPKRVDV